MVRQYIGIILFFQLKILASEVLHYELILHKKKTYDEGYIEVYLPFQDSHLYTKISLAHSRLFCGKKNDDFNITDIDISSDDIYPNKKKTGKFAIGKFNITTHQNITLNIIYSNSFYSFLGLAREVDYSNPEIEKEYNMDFMSQLIKNGIINKFYIYFTPFYNNDGTLYPHPYLELGRFPNPFDTYSKFSSYSPLNNKYPKKWSLSLSYILFGNFDPKNISDKNKKEIHADVIFTEFFNNKNYIPETYKIFFDDIFINHFNCETYLHSYTCPNSILETKFYFVFNGFAHLIPNNLLFSSSELSNVNYTNFLFTSEIDYISFDSDFFGVYHRLFDKENNTIRFVYPKDEKYILDVQSLGYENRNGVKKEYEDIEFLRKWNIELKEKEKNINITLNEIELKKKNLDKKEEELNNWNKNLSNLEKELKEKEKNINITLNDLELKKKNLDKREEEIKKKEKEIEGKNKKIDELEKKITKLEKENNVKFVIIIVLLFIFLIIMIIIIKICIDKSKKKDIPESTISLINE